MPLPILPIATGIAAAGGAGTLVHTGYGLRKLAGNTASPDYSTIDTSGEFSLAGPQDTAENFARLRQYSFEQPDKNVHKVVAVSTPETVQRAQAYHPIYSKNRELGVIPEEVMYAPEYTVARDLAFHSPEEDTELTKKDIETLAKETVRGKYGNGEERKKALGENYQAVQDYINANRNPLGLDKKNNLDWFNLLLPLVAAGGLGYLGYRKLR